MFGFAHAPELIILVLLAVLIFGPKRLPDLGRSLGRGIRNFRSETTAMRGELTSVRDELLAATEPAQTSTASAVSGTEPKSSSSSRTRGDG
jgi:TatA/E family protein of Tat protein translocase